MVLVWLIFLVAIDHTQLCNAVVQWIPEIKATIENKSPVIVLVGTKIDLRDKPDIVKRLKEDGKEPISEKKGEAMAKKLQCRRFVECSALTQVGLQSVFEESVRAIKEQYESSKKKKKGKGKDKDKDKDDCVVM